MIEIQKEEKKYLECSTPELSGNYSIFYYGDGFLTAYNEDKKIEKYMKESDFVSSFLKSDTLNVFL